MLGDKDSYVHGSISDGIFHGRIVTSKDSYFVEKAQYYFPNHSHAESGFHSVIYKDQHVDDPYRLNRTVHANGCGLTEDVAHWMDRVQNSADILDEEVEIVQQQQHQHDEKGSMKTGNDSKSHFYQHVNNRIFDESAHEKYSKEANSRPKRATVRYQEKNTCSLYIQTDPLIWRHIRESIPDVSSIFEKRAQLAGSINDQKNTDLNCHLTFFFIVLSTRSTMIQIERQLSMKRQRRRFCHSSLITLQP